MDQRLIDYLGRAYRRDIFGESIEVEMPEVNLAEVDAELARIDALGLGANLVNRAFVDWQNRRALIALRDKLRSNRN